MPAPHALLLDFDGLLADYNHRRFLAVLAERSQRAPEEVDAALRIEGLELAHARGELDAAQLLQALSERLGSTLQADDWHQARLAATTPRRDCITLLHRISADTQLAILTNNGALTLPVIEQLLPGLRVLGSATLGVRKPDPRAYLNACTALGSDPAHTAFVDHLFRNVQGARAAGLQADTAHHAQSLRRLLRRWHLLS